MAAAMSAAWPSIRIRRSSTRVNCCCTSTASGWAALAEPVRRSSISCSCAHSRHGTKGQATFAQPPQAIERKLPWTLRFIGFLMRARNEELVGQARPSVGNERLDTVGEDVKEQVRRGSSYFHCQLGGIMQFQECFG